MINTPSRTGKQQQNLGRRNIHLMIAFPNLRKRRRVVTNIKSRPTKNTRLGRLAQWWDSQHTSASLIYCWCHGVLRSGIVFVLIFVVMPCTAPGRQLCILGIYCSGYISFQLWKHNFTHGELFNSNSNRFSELSFRAKRKHTSPSNTVKIDAESIGSWTSIRIQAPADFNSVRHALGFKNVNPSDRSLLSCALWEI